LFYLLAHSRIKKQLHTCKHTQEGILHLVLKPPSTCRWRTLRPFLRRPKGVFHPHLWTARDPFWRCRLLVACPSHGVSLASQGVTFCDVTWCIDLVTSFDAIVVSFCLFIFSDVVERACVSFKGYVVVLSPLLLGHLNDAPPPSLLSSPCGASLPMVPVVSGYLCDSCMIPLLSPSSFLLCPPLPS